jgi:hypothetical protein
MRAIKRFLPGQKVLILSKEILLEAGYPDNNDQGDFINLIAGKEITLDEVFEDGEIYTCIEYPGIAIYKVFIEKLVNYGDELTYAEISFMLQSGTKKVVRDLINRVCKDIAPAFNNYGE